MASGDGNNASWDIHKITGKTDAVAALAATLDKSILSVGEQGTITLKTLLDNTGFAAHVTNVKAAASDNSVLKVEETTWQRRGLHRRRQRRKYGDGHRGANAYRFRRRQSLRLRNVTFSFYIEVAGRCPQADIRRKCGPFQPRPHAERRRERAAHGDGDPRQRDG